MAKAIRDKVNGFFITWPHCDVGIEKLLDLLQNHPFGLTQYVLVSAETHQDGEQHRHAYVQFVEKHSIPRKEMAYVFDILKEWQMGGYEGTIRYMWIRDRWNVDYIMNEAIKPGEDKEDEGTWYRRWHPNIDTIGKGGPRRVIQYVKKGGQYVSAGICPIRDEMTRKDKNNLLLRTDLSKLVDDGEISILCLPQLQKALNIYRDAQRQPTFDKKIVHWYWGKTGAGKTKAAWEEARSKYGEEATPDAVGSIWCSSSDGRWFDGYEGQPAVILDDIRPSGWSFALMLRLLDRYPLRVPVKGGFRNWIPKEIWVTAPAVPRELYRNYTTGEPYEGIEQLERRVDDVRQFGEGGGDTISEAVDSFIQKEIDPWA